MVRELQDYERLISDLAAFLDPLAFERARDIKTRTMIVAR